MEKLIEQNNKYKEALANIKDIIYGETGAKTVQRRFNAILEIVKEAQELKPTKAQPKKELYLELLKVVEPYLSDCTGLNEDGEFDIILEVKELLEN